MQFHSGNGGRTNCTQFASFPKFGTKHGKRRLVFLCMKLQKELDEMFMLESCDDLSLPRREESHQVKLLMLHGGW